MSCFKIETDIEKHVCFPGRDSANTAALQEKALKSSNVQKSKFQALIHREARRMYAVLHVTWLVHEKKCILFQPR